MLYFTFMYQYVSKKTKSSHIYLIEDTNWKAAHTQMDKFLRLQYGEPVTCDNLGSYIYLQSNSPKPIKAPTLNHIYTYPNFSINICRVISHLDLDLAQQFVLLNLENPHKVEKEYLNLLQQHSSVVSTYIVPPEPDKSA